MKSLNPFTLLGGVTGIDFKKTAKDQGERAAKALVRAELVKRFQAVGTEMEKELAKVENYLTQSTPQRPQPHQHALADIQFRLYRGLFGKFPGAGEIADEFRDNHESRVYGMCANKVNEKTALKDVINLVIECEMSVLL